MTMEIIDVESFKTEMQGLKLSFKWVHVAWKKLISKIMKTQSLVK